jgi:hypothetical protein
MAHLSVGEKAEESGKLHSPSAFIDAGEREGAPMVPHIGDKALAAPWRVLVSPISGL